MQRTARVSRDILLVLVLFAAMLQTSPGSASSQVVMCLYHPLSSGASSQACTKLFRASLSVPGLVVSCTEATSSTECSTMVQQGTASLVMLTGLDLITAMTTHDGNLQPVIAAAATDDNGDSALVCSTTWRNSGPAQQLVLWLTHSSSSYSTSGFDDGADATFLQQGRAIGMLPGKSGPLREVQTFAQVVSAGANYFQISPPYNYPGPTPTTSSQVVMCLYHPLSSGASSQACTKLFRASLSVPGLVVSCTEAASSTECSTMVQQGSASLVMLTGLDLIKAAMTPHDSNLQPVIAAAATEGNGDSALVCSTAWRNSEPAQLLVSWLTHSSSSYSTSGFDDGADATFLQQGRAIGMLPGKSGPLREVQTFAQVVSTEPHYFQTSPPYDNYPGPTTNNYPGPTTNNYPGPTSPTTVTTAEQQQQSNGQQQQSVNNNYNPAAIAGIVVGCVLGTLLIPVLLLLVWLKKRHAVEQQLPLAKPHTIDMEVLFPGEKSSELVTTPSNAPKLPTSTTNNSAV